MPTDNSSTISVFAPSLFITVTIEANEEGEDDIHIHPGGQGLWVARGLKRLGERPVIVGPAGGEAGRALVALVPGWGISLNPITTKDPSPTYVHDRRGDERRELARSPLPVLDRHELDDLYGKILEKASATGICVVTGKSEGDSLPLDLFERMGADFDSLGVEVIGDLHGEELESFLSGGPISTLKVSDEDLVEDGLLDPSAPTQERVDAAEKLQARGAKSVIISGADGGTVGRFHSRSLAARLPKLQAVDHRGSGDAMTAALAHALRRGIEPTETLMLACAAGAANVTRHGLANPPPELVQELSKQVEVEDLAVGA